MPVVPRDSVSDHPRMVTSILLRTLRRVSPLALLLPLACGNAVTGNDGALQDAVATDTQTTGDAPAGDAPGTDAGGALYLPAGYSLTPFLSADPIRTFTAAGMATVPARDYLAVIETDVGRIVLDLYEDQTPITVNSFIFLARNHFFDGQAFHRVINAFVAQGGDPNTVDGDPRTWGTGGPGYMFGLEIVPTLRYDGAGVLAMARAMSPNSNGSQFFITLAATPMLNDQYTIFGRVTEGMDVLPNIVRGQPPANPTRMLQAYIVERAR